MNKGSIASGALERAFMEILTKTLGRLIVNTANRLQVDALISSGTVTTVTTVTTCTTLSNITNWGATNANGKTQLDTAQNYYAGFRKNLS
jgi:hypothetical protein